MTQEKTATEVFNENNARLADIKERKKRGETISEADEDFADFWQYKLDDWASDNDF